MPGAENQAVLSGLTSDNLKEWNTGVWGKPDETSDEEPPRFRASVAGMGQLLPEFIR